MNMTHYMSLLASNQPWNLLIFMTVPVICAETLTITEFFIIFNRIQKGGARTLNKIVGIFDGLYFTGIFIYLFFTTVIPLTTTGGWHTKIHFILIGDFLVTTHIAMIFGMVNPEIIRRMSTMPN